MTTDRRHVPFDMRADPVQDDAVTRTVWLILGCVNLILGFIGALLPLMPTTIFLILAAGCFARSSPRLEAWLLGHSRFGPSIIAWRTHGAIPRRAKIAACCGISSGLVIFWFTVRPHAGIMVAVALVMAGCAGWILSRPGTGGL